MSTLYEIERWLADWVNMAVSSCSAPFANRPVVYHCTPPSDCCDRVSVNWGGFTSRGAGAGIGIPGGGCPGPASAELVIRVTRCWPVTETTATDYDQTEVAAQQLATDAECLYSALQTLVCEGIDGAPCEKVSFVSLSPMCPLGGCAGVEAHVQVPLSGVAVSV